MICIICIGRYVGMCLYVSVLVCIQVWEYWAVLVSICMYCTYWYVLTVLVCICMYWSVLTCLGFIGIYLVCMVCTGLYLYVLVSNDM